MFRGVPFGLERFAGVTGALAAAAALFSPTAHAAEKAPDERRPTRPLARASPNKLPRTTRLRLSIVAVGFDVACRRRGRI